MSKKKLISAILVFAALMSTVSATMLPPTPAKATTASTYADFSLIDKFAYGQIYATGTNQVGSQWAWAPQPDGTSRIMWGAPWAPDKPPSYQEEFQHVGEWVLLNGWYDNGTFYRLKTTTEWQAAGDCRTGRTFLPTGGPEHYVLWTIPATDYCLYSEYTVTEESSGHVFRAIHQQVWSPPAACPKNAPPNALRRPGEIYVTVTDCVRNWESWADDRTRAPGDFRTTQEGASLLARGFGMGYQIRRTIPAWSGDERYAGLWG